MYPTNDTAGVTEAEGPNNLDHNDICDTRSQLEEWCPEFSLTGPQLNDPIRSSERL